MDAATKAYKDKTPLEERSAVGIWRAMVAVEDQGYLEGHGCNGYILRA